MADAQEKAFLDLTGERCPMTFVKVKLALDCLSEGESLEVELSGADAARNVSQSLKSEGHRITAVRRNGESWNLVVEKH